MTPADRSCAGVARALVAALPALLVAACADIGGFPVSLPANERPVERSTPYPNVNLTPERPLELRSRQEIVTLEQELQELRERHVEDNEAALERRGPL